jgi:hypothetical protein
MAGEMKKSIEIPQSGKLFKKNAIMTQQGLLRIANQSVLPIKTAA